MHFRKSKNSTIKISSENKNFIGVYILNKNTLHSKNLLSNRTFLRLISLFTVYFKQHLRQEMQLIKHLSNEYIYNL